MIICGFSKALKKLLNTPKNPTIRAKSVGPLRRNYQWFSPLPIFNVDPYRTGTDSTIERNIETGGGKGELHLDTKDWG